MKLSSFIATAVVLACAVGARAEVYRCVSPSGKVEYSDAPCEKGEKSRTVDVRANVIESTGLREQALRMENEALKEELKSRPATSSVPAGGRDVAPATDAARIDSAACKTAQRDYDVSASSSANSKEALRAKESFMYAACGIREPDRTDVNVRIGDEVPRYVVPQRLPAPVQPPFGATITVPPTQQPPLLFGPRTAPRMASGASAPAQPAASAPAFSIIR